MAKNRIKTSDFSRDPGPEVGLGWLGVATASRGGDPRERALVVILIVIVIVIVIIIVIPRTEALLMVVTLIMAIKLPNRTTEE